MIHRIANLIGGLAIPKQLRLLKKRPHILIGTPGRYCLYIHIIIHRIWYFMEEHVIPQSALFNIRFVICDEVDKLVFILFNLLDD